MAQPIFNFEFTPVYGLNLLQQSLSELLLKNEDAESDGRISGMLLYVKTEEGGSLDIDYMVDGSRISVKILDLK